MEVKHLTEHFILCWFKGLIQHISRTHLNSYFAKVDLSNASRMEKNSSGQSYKLLALNGHSQDVAIQPIWLTAGYPLVQGGSNSVQ